ncbi:hypothetical protein E2562_032373 [Oryza meyeriana var. granulata]|uniref:Uncharacterized protein n=1 Tax=Oryza meyeriana var. granulata TaxID=110450 RepID=A0A6G1E4D7_9ORYZ|nr:hypothetical protein E2562_032373 [Oryza meyeriana var. granulata]
MAIDCDTAGRPRWEEEGVTDGNTGLTGSTGSRRWTTASRRRGKGARCRDIRQRRRPTKGRTGRAAWCSLVAGDDLGRHIGVGLQSQGDDGGDCLAAATQNRRQVGTEQAAGQAQGTEQA